MPVLADAPPTEVTVSAIAPTAIAANIRGQHLMKRCTKATFGPPLRLTFLLHGVNQRFYTLVPLTVKDDRTSSDVSLTCSSAPSCDTCPRSLGTDGDSRGEDQRRSSSPAYRLLDPAHRLFCSQGVPATTMLEITSACARRRTHSTTTSTRRTTSWCDSSTSLEWSAAARFRSKPIRREGPAGTALH
jgi:hypothetical protein